MFSTWRMEVIKSMERNKEKLVSVKDFSKICRICLLENKGTPFVDAMFKDKRVIDILSEHFVIEVNTEDCLPPYICNRCSDEVFKMCALIERCQKADVFLRSCLKSSGKQDQIGISDSVIQEDENEVDVELPDITLQHRIEVDRDSSLVNNIQSIIDEWSSDTESISLDVDSSNLDTKRDDNKHNLKRRVIIHTGKGKHKCEISGKVCPHLTAFTNHKKTHISEEQIDPETGVSCPLCGRIYKRATYFNAHLKKHKANEFFSSKTRKASTKENERLYECTVCNKSYKTPDSLHVHQKQHGSEKPYLCNTCGKRFLVKSVLKDHMLIHTGTKQYLCNICGKSFRQAPHLMKHMLIHTGEKPHKCNYCNKGFTIKRNLTIHVRRHTGEKPYVCSVCCKGFYDSTNMKRHIKSHEKSSKKKGNNERG